MLVARELVRPGNGKSGRCGQCWHQPEEWEHAAAILQAASEALVERPHPDEELHIVTVALLMIMSVVGTRLRGGGYLFL